MEQEKQIEKQVEKNIQKKDIFDKIMALPGLNIFESIYYKYKEVLLYLFFGGLTTVISIGSYSYCDVALHMNPLVANIISWILAVLFAYVTNKIWVFNAGETWSKGSVFGNHQFLWRTFVYISCRGSDSFDLY